MILSVYNLCNLLSVLNKYNINMLQIRVALMMYIGYVVVSYIDNICVY